MRRWLALGCLVIGCGGTVVESVDASGDGASLDSAATDTATVVDTAPVDTGTALTEACAAAGGAYCTNNRWELCPAGFEPLGAMDGHLGCGMIGGWCCVPAPASTCSASGKGNCVPGGCTGCWMKVSDPSLACEDGRGCCVDACD